MWRPPHEIRADLESREPARIEAGLRDAVDASDSFDEFPLPLLSAELLQPFGAEPPREVQLALARLFERYDSFQPALDEAERRRRILELALAYACNAIALEATLAAKISEDPAREAAKFVDVIASHDLANQTTLLGARRVVSYLLDGKAPVRAAAVEAMRTHRVALAQVIEHLRPELTSTELKTIEHASPTS